MASELRRTLNDAVQYVSVKTSFAAEGLPCRDALNIKEQALETDGDDEKHKKTRIFVTNSASPKSA